MPEPRDKILYEKIKNEIISKYKPSAYRSGMIVKKYKEEYMKKYNRNDSYIGSKSNSNLRRWFNEKWVNQRGEVGYKRKGDIYRPTVRINEKTPTTYNELSKNQIEKAQTQKKKTGRVNQFAKL